MDWKKIGKALLYPPMWLMLLLVPTATVFLVFSMIFLGVESVISIISYVISAYTLTVWCFRIPYLVSFFKAFKNENKYARRWFEDERLRVNVSLYGSLGWNAAYALFQLWLGYYHSTFWYYSFAVYYISLAVMRFFLLSHSRSYKPGERMREELKKYRACGWVFLIMNLALTLIVFFMVYWNRTFIHHEITTIAMAAYTFTSFTAAIVSIVRYRKYNSPVYSATKAIGLAAACVSLLTLESTMLTTFADGTMDPASTKLMLGISGGVIVAFIIVMAVHMIRESTKKLSLINTEEITDGKQ